MHNEVAHGLRPFQAGSESTVSDLPTIRGKSVDPASIITQAVPVLGGPPTIAVLPFQNLSEDSRYRLFGDAVAQTSLWICASYIRYLSLLAGLHFSFSPLQPTSMRLAVYSAHDTWRLAQSS